MTRIRGGGMTQELEYDYLAEYEWLSQQEAQKKQERETELKDWCKSMKVPYNDSRVNTVENVVNAVTAFKVKGFSKEELKSAGFNNEILIAAGFKELIYVPPSPTHKTSDEGDFAGMYKNEQLR